MTTPRSTQWSLIHKPTPKQAAFLCLDSVSEAFYGGAAGGGKSDALLMGGAQYVDVPGYAALILRRNFKQLSLPGSLMARSKEWWRNTGALWNEGTKTWTFPSGATITFGHVQNPDDVSQYESAEFQYIAFDEVTQFEEPVYRFLFSRLRRLKGATVPLRMRSASNPRGVGFNWVKRRFVDPATRADGAVFIPARLEDNPYLDYEEYVAQLAALPPVLREKLLAGDWEIMESGEMFNPWVDLLMVDHSPRDHVATRARAWDLAFSAKTEDNAPDYTVGVRMSVSSKTGLYTIEHVERFQCDPAETQRRIRATSELDGELVRIGIEKTPGAGKQVFEDYQRNVLRGFRVEKLNPSGMTKPERAGTYSAAMGSELIQCVRGPWNDDFFTEHVQFPDDCPNDDQVDAATYAFRMVAQPPGAVKTYDPTEGGNRLAALDGRR